MSTGPNGQPRDRRYVLETAVEESNLHYRHRHILLTLLRHADTKTGFIPDQYSPSIKRLEQWTGIRHATLLSDLNRLEEMGWLIRERPKTRGRGHRSLYRVTPPRSAPAPVRAGIAGKPADPRQAQAQGNGTGPGGRGGHAEGPGPGDRQLAEAPLARPRTRREAAAHMIREYRPGLDDAVIERVLDQLDGPKTRNLPGLVQACIENKDIDQYLNQAAQHQVGTPGPPNAKDLCTRCWQPGHATDECTI
jgi:hypothetical protein